MSATRTTSRRKKRSRGLRVETLAKRELMAADLGGIGGTAFLDTNGDGTFQIGTETALANVTVNLYRDANASGTVGAFDVGDVQARTITLNTGDNGLYQFLGLDGADADGVTTSGIYFLEVVAESGGVQNQSGTPIADAVLPGVQTITITDTDENGTTQTTVDGFTASQSGLPSNLTSPNTVTLSSGSITGVLGGERDVEHRFVSDADMDVSSSNFSVTSGVATLENGVGVTATLLLQYDGLDSEGGGLTLDPVGLRAGGATGVNLSNGESGAGLIVSIGADRSADDFIRVRVYTDANNASEAFIDVINATREVFIPFSGAGGFVPIAGFAGGADFTNVGAIEAEVLETNPASEPIPAGIDVTVSVIESRVSNVQTVNSAVGVQMSLGGQLFVDNGGGVDKAEQNNGVSDTGEPFFLGNVANRVVVQLFDTDPTVGSPAPIATTTVDVAADPNGGSYLFDTVGTDPLLPGTYYVLIPEVEFNTGGPLNGYIGSEIDTPGNGGVDVTDDDADNDNDGVFVAGLGFLSGPITLTVGGEPGGSNINTTVDFGVVPTTDLRIDKTINTADPDSNLIVGGRAVFDITVTNRGLNPATGVRAQEVIPSGLTLVDVRDSSNTLVATANEDTGGETIRGFNVGTLAPGATATFKITMDVGAGVTEDLLNRIRVTGFEIESDADTIDADRPAGEGLQGALANNTATEVVDLPFAALSVTKTDSLTTTTAGSQITYTIVVSNTGGDNAQNVTALDTLPAGVTFVSGTFTSGTGTVAEITTGTDAGKILATLGTLTPGASETFTIVVDISADFPDGSSPLNNSIIASADNAPDATASDNTAVTRLTDVTVAKAIIRTRTPNARGDNNTADDLIDSTAPFQAFAGGFATYQITATNSGPSVARGVQITDTLPTGLSLVTGSFNAGTSGVTAPAVTGQQLSFAVPNLAPGVSRVFTFEVAIASNQFTATNNSVSILTSDPESNSTNNTGAVSITPAAQIDLMLDKTVSPATAVPGRDTVVYAFTVSHDLDSVSDAINVDVTDVLPAGLTGVTIDGIGITSQNFNTTNRQLLVEYASIPVGETRTFTVTAMVNNDATGTIINNASVSVPGVTDLDMSNNTDNATITLTPRFDLVVTKTAGGTGTFGPLDSVTYTIVVSHDTNDDGTEADDGLSPSKATGVVLTDVLPAGLTFTSATADGVAATPTSTTGGNIVFGSFDLAPGSTRTYTITAAVNDDAPAGTLTNNVSFVTAAGETDTTNNAASTTVTIVPQSNVSVTKTVDKATSQVGDNLTYTIIVNNSGPSSAQNVIAVDTLPSGVTFISGSGPNGALTATGQTVTVNGGTLAAAGSFQFTVVARVNAGVTASQVNTVNVTTTTTETNTTDNAASTTTAIDQAINELTGMVFRDFNNDGILNGMDNPLAGIEVLLTGGNSGTDGRRTTTDADGKYRFGDLIAGTYSVRRVNKPEFFNDGLETAGPNATPADATEETIQVLVGGSNPTSATVNDFALVPFISYKLCIL